MLKALAIDVHRLKQWIAINFPFLIPKSRGGIHHMVLSVVLIALALMVRFSIAPVDAGWQYVVFFPAVTLAAVVGGFKPGLLATLIGAFFGTYFFTPPYHSISMEVLRRAFWGNIVFLMDGLVVSISIAAMHRYRTQLAQELKKSIDVNSMMAIDISRRIKAEEALKKSRAQLKTFVSQAPIAIAMFDRDMNYLETSGQWLHEFGRGYANLYGHNHYQVNPDLPEKWKQVHQQCLSGAILKNDEDLWVRADGSKCWLRWAVMPWIDENDVIGGLIISAEDITEHKQNEARLAEQAWQLQETDRRKDEFLAMLAHELRNPLAPISNAVEILKLTALEPAQIARCTDIINRQVKHLARLVDDLLDVSRISRGLVELKKESLEVRDFILPAVETCQPQIDIRRHTLSLTLPPDPVWVEGDRIRLAQVVSNLINNAAKYTEEGGHIGLSVEASSSEVCIHVSDNGSGIDPADLSCLFDLFYQADRNIDRAQGGLGIGLSLVHNLVAKHGGNVQAFSAGRGQGSEFVIRLPRLILSTPATPITTAPTAPCLNKLRILIVDDNRDITESLALLLESDGHQVLTAFDGISALETARIEQPDIILLDIGLPGMDGYSVAQALRRNHGLERIMLIALTGYGQPDDRKKSNASGFDEHLVKPIDIEKLRKLLASYQTTNFHESP